MKSNSQRGYPQIHMRITIAIEDCCSTLNLLGCLQDLCMSTGASITIGISLTQVYPVLDLSISNAVVITL